MKKPKKAVSAATIIIVLVLGAGAAVVAAMFLSDDADELFKSGRDKVTQPLELRGRWLGMSLTSTDSASARAKNIPPKTRGVIVLEIAERDGWRARQAGVRSGDVITGVDGTSVRDMADFYEVSRNTDVSQAIVLDVQRWGQTMSLVLPAAVVATPPGAQPGAVQPAAPLQPPAGAQIPGAMPAAQPQATSPMFACPLHRQAWSQQAVHPHYRCPMCNRQLVQQVP